MWNVAFYATLLSGLFVVCVSGQLKNQSKGTVNVRPTAATNPKAAANKTPTGGAVAPPKATIPKRGEKPSDRAAPAEKSNAARPPAAPIPKQRGNEQLENSFMSPQTQGALQGSSNIFFTVPSDYKVCCVLCQDPQQKKQGIQSGSRSHLKFHGENNSNMVLMIPASHNICCSPCAGSYTPEKNQKGNNPMVISAVLGPQGGGPNQGNPHMKPYMPHSGGPNQGNPHMNPYNPKKYQQDYYNYLNRMKQFGSNSPLNIPQSHYRGYFRNFRKKRSAEPETKQLPLEQKTDLPEFKIIIIENDHEDPENVTSALYPYLQQPAVTGSLKEVLAQNLYLELLDWKLRNITGRGIADIFEGNEPKFRNPRMDGLLKEISSEISKMKISFQNVQASSPQFVEIKRQIK